MAYAYKVEPGWVDVKSVPLTLPRLAPELGGYRLVHISDLHMDEWMTRSRLAEIVELINRQRCHPECALTAVLRLRCLH